MPNTTGGKNYKKSKHVSGSFEPAFIDRQPDQMYGRIIKNLGNKNLLVYCNDNRTRLCHIRGSMRKRVWINVGDIVLISARDFEKKPSETGKTYEKGDIVAKYDQEHLSKLKKQDDINPKLFMQLETADGAILKELSSRDDKNAPSSLDALEFDFDYSEEPKKEGEEKKETGSESESDSDWCIDEI
jgi:translation initiation factor 1A